jgi:nucleoid DNA-binding protein
MTSRIAAIKATRPQIDLDPTLSTQLLIEHIAGRTGLNAGEVMLMAYELCDALSMFLSMGQPIHLEKVGTFTPDVRVDGTIFVHFRPGPELKRRLNAPDAFSGRLRNRQNIGKTSDDLVTQWNGEHPDDRVEE